MGPWPLHRCTARGCLARAGARMPGSARVVLGCRVVPRGVLPHSVRCPEREPEGAQGALEHGALRRDHAAQHHGRVQRVGHGHVGQLAAAAGVRDDFPEPLRLPGSATPHGLELLDDVSKLGNHLDLMPYPVPHRIPLLLRQHGLDKVFVGLGRARPEQRVLPLGEEVPVQVDPDIRVSDRPGDQKPGEPRVVRCLKAQRLDELQEVVLELVILCAGEDAYRVASDLFIAEVGRQELEGVGDIDRGPPLHEIRGLLGLLGVGPINALEEAGEGALVRGEAEPEAPEQPLLLHRQRAVRGLPEDGRDAAPLLRVGLEVAVHHAPRKAARELLRLYLGGVVPRHLRVVQDREPARSHRDRRKGGAHACRRLVVQDGVLELRQLDRQRHLHAAAHPGGFLLQDMLQLREGELVQPLYPGDLTPVVALAEPLKALDLSAVLRLWLPWRGGREGAVPGGLGRQQEPVPPRFEAPLLAEEAEGCTAAELGQLPFPELPDCKGEL
mmetsp:Transcript_623/g.1492  ORF Transcript_623/g.1492 Transcript_623/m.1492 type:complete len:498 (-) Transcript_623:555-2048(-)